MYAYLVGYQKSLPKKFFNESLFLQHVKLRFYAA